MRRLPAQLINLASCEGAESENRGAGSKPTPTGDTPELGLSFVLDLDALRCLAETLQKENWLPEAIKSFEVRRDCAQN